MAADVRALVTQAAARYGVDPAALLRIAEMESGLNPAARNPRSSAGGLFQFIDGTARAYGLADRFDPVQASDAGARYARDAAESLRRGLGRDPAGGELYLAHQQGPAGALRLLRNPDAPAASLVGERAVTLNGGTPDMTGRQFADLWINRFGGRRGAPAGAGGGVAQAGTPAAPPPEAPAPQPALPASLAQAFSPAPPAAPALAAMYAMPDLSVPAPQRPDRRRERARRQALYG